MAKPFLLYFSMLHAPHGTNLFVVHSVLLSTLHFGIAVSSSVEPRYWTNNFVINPVGAQRSRVRWTMML